ncbi:twin-arginine translocase subunit TatB [Acinetobacter wanghuae]|uniref:Sec-independent protein translocase protein TatB n=1 Tax=Acinetobacter wanghuae TaxID=2662362 RepID=A0A5Q0P0N0_9GAMM|nr:Sec-independent protein translocase protein TatB [Acinetobacter wanghuae]MQW90918.1 twin-arginine translocase subunit TatB [Acinetobacter wanghuae]QGA10252.1 twin-arginine translocase subunit TatB [Acinetobacter wanghuae]
MLNIGMTELLIFGIIALLVLGPEKLPEAVRFIGKWYGKIKRTVSNIQNDFDRELRLSELREQMQTELKRIQELEMKMQMQMNELQQPIQSGATEKKPTLSQAHCCYHPMTHPLNSVYLPQYFNVNVPQNNHVYAELKVAI